MQLTRVRIAELFRSQVIRREKHDDQSCGYFHPSCPFRSLSENRPPQLAEGVGRRGGYGLIVKIGPQVQGQIPRGFVAFRGILFQALQGDPIEIAFEQVLELPRREIALGGDSFFRLAGKRGVALGGTGCFFQANAFYEIG